MRGRALGWPSGSNWRRRRIGDRDPAAGPHHRRPRVGRRRTAAARSGIMHDRSGMEAVSVGARGRFAHLLRYVDAELRPMLQGQVPELEQDFVAYIVAGYRSLFPELDFAEPELRSLQALRYQMITLAETYPRERQAGAQEGDGIRASVLGRGDQPGFSTALVRAGGCCLAFAPRLARGLSGRAQSSAVVAGRKQRLCA